MPRPSCAQMPSIDLCKVVFPNITLGDQAKAEPTRSAACEYSSPTSITVASTKPVAGIKVN